MPVLDPGRRRTRICQFWAHAMDDRPWGGPAPPAVAYVFADGRGTDEIAGQLADFSGILQVDGYAAYKALARGHGGTIQLAFCLIARRVGQGERHHAFGHFLAKRGNTRGTGLVAQQALDTVLHEPLLPAPDEVLDLAVRRMISTVPAPSALNSTMAARQACFWAALWSLLMASSRRRSVGVRVREIPVRMRQTRTPGNQRESPAGLLCQEATTIGCFQSD
jgi:hypothetical protein